VLPDWFDLHVLENTVAVAAALCALGMVYVLARVRHLAAKVVLVVVLAGLVGSLVFYRAVPLQHCQKQSSCKFLKSELPSSAASVNAPNAHSSN
jgi:hypothetical protein